MVMEKENGVEHRKGEELLKCILTEAEKKDISEQMAQAVEKMASLEDQLSSLSKEFKAKIAEQQANLNKSASLIRQGYEYRQVPIEITLDYKRTRVLKTRMDTMQDFEDRPMKENERQQRLVEK